MSTPVVAAVGCNRADFLCLSDVLAGAGIRTCFAPSQSEIDEQSGLGDVAVIICDADRVDWAAALRHFKSDHPNSPVVFLTRLADEHVWLDMLQSGAYDLLQKPYQARDLRWVVCSALKRAA